MVVEYYGYTHCAEMKGIPIPDVNSEMEASAQGI